MGNPKSLFVGSVAKVGARLTEEANSPNRLTSAEIQALLV